MKRLVCEMCGGTDLVKQDGVFVCQNCGTKYSVEEAKKMMVEGAVTVEGTVAVEGTVKVDKTEELKKLYTLARRAKESDNTENACRYYTQIEMQDPDSWEAYFYLIYFKARTTKIADIPEDCKNLTNCFATTMDLLFKSSANEDEIRTSLNMILADIKHIADIMLNSVDSITADSIDLENYSGDALIDALPYKASILKMMDSLGDSIVANKKYIDIAAVVWKSEIELFMAHYGEFKTYDPLKTTYSYFVKGSSTKLKLAHKSSNFADGVAKYLIPDVAKKIYEIDPTYDDPFGVSKELRKNEKFITCPKCGTKMREREEKCPQCGISKEEIQRLIKEQAEREAAERERIRKEREAQEAEDARIREEERAKWWAANKKKVIVTILTIIALLIGIIVYHKIAENKRYQQALAEAKAYIASGDSCVAIYHFDEAQEFYELAKQTGVWEYGVYEKESALREAQKEADQEYNDALRRLKVFLDADDGEFSDLSNACLDKMIQIYPDRKETKYFQQLRKGAGNDNNKTNTSKIKTSIGASTTIRSDSHVSREDAERTTQQEREVNNYSQTEISVESSSTEKSQSEIDILDMNNTTPFNVVKWKVEYSSYVLDAWFSEKSGLITDSRGWTGGMSESMGWYALHRFNRKQYTCNYLHSSNSLGGDGYGDNLGVKKAVRDRERNTLPIEDGYYILDLRDWQGYKPLYLPYSQEYLKSKWQRGMIKFEYR